jgi:hypothetical protein
MRAARLPARLVALVAAGVLAVAPSARAQAGTGPYVDGISDQGLTAWDGAFGSSYFAGLFRWAWIESRPRPITMARYVVQWNALDGGYPRYSLELGEWLRDIRALGLVPVLSLTSFDGTMPASSAEYAAQLERILQRADASDPVPYLEPWNEPNDQGGYRRVREAATPAEFANAAAELCARSQPRCAIVAGDLQDSPTAAAYADEYRRHLAFRPAIWGVHPYYSVGERSEAPLRALEAGLPPGAAVWFTEIAARRCTAFGGRERDSGESGQAALAQWLVGDLIPHRRPRHVFYYDFLMRERREPACAQQHEDPFLYVPGSAEGQPDVARAAAAPIYWGGPAPVAWAATLGVPSPAAASPLLVTLYAAGAGD